ncbi:cystathione beta-lyase [Paramicrobacterium humi]|uniref:cysteine-S-conjugate beta-lyase n=1 Tax=Paramicrobacterium humi TaxID=640635 RepID=A0A1H4IYD4_9MICO|nr:aminotransferase class I/II-fold pyridoxal phosphate-dependent enzyme [Microbacterium humi]SEB38282.1 cystathione beta-lyase [Microbacterium humi]
MTFADEIDAKTLDVLRASGGLKWTDPDVPIGAFVAEMDFGVAPVISTALHEAVDAGVFGYMPPAMGDELKQATAERLRDKQGWEITAKQVFPVPDVIKALEVTIEHFSKPGSKVIVPTPSYMPFLFVPPTLGREVIEVPMLNDDGVWRFDLDVIQRAYDDGGDVLILCNPYNPLGRVFTREELAGVSEVVDRNGGRVFSDEIWAPLVYPGSELVSYATVSDVAAGHTITGVSASKAWNLPGLKCAQLIVSNDADQAVLDEIGMWIGHGASNLGAIANTVAYREGQPWLDGVVDYLDGNRRELVSLVEQHLPGVRVSMPQGTYVGWLDFRDTGIENPGEHFREHAGVGLTDGSACGVAGVGSARFIFAMPRPVMREAIVRMAAALERQAA